MDACGTVDHGCPRPCDVGRGGATLPTALSSTGGAAPSPGALPDDEFVFGNWRAGALAPWPISIWREQAAESAMGAVAKGLVIARPRLPVALAPGAIQTASRASSA